MVTRKGRLHLRVLELEGRWVPGVLTDQPLVDTAGQGLGSVNLVALGSPTPNNDNANAKVNFASFDLSYAAVGPIDRVLEVNNSNGVTEYWIEDNVTNASASTWFGFYFQLGFGTGAQFDMRGSPALDMDWPDQDPTPSNFTTYTFRDLSHQRYKVEWSNGQISDQGRCTFFYMIDVSDWDALNMPPSAQTPNGYRFTLRAVPVAKIAGGEERPALVGDVSTLAGHTSAVSAMGGSALISARPISQFAQSGSIGSAASPSVVDEASLQFARVVFANTHESPNDSNRGASYSSRTDVFDSSDSFDFARLLA